MRSIEDVMHEVLMDYDMDQFDANGVLTTFKPLMRLLYLRGVMDGNSNYTTKEWTDSDYMDMVEEQVELEEWFEDIFV